MTAKLYAAAILLTSATIISCAGNKDKEVVDNSVIPTGTEAAASQQTVTTSNTATTVNPNMAPAAPATVVPGGPVVPGTNSGTVSFKPQPVTVTPQNTVATAPQTTTITPAQTTTVTAPGMNPPHGQPGHRCDIQVGAPLNSKPAAPATVQAAPQTTTLNAGQNPSNVTIQQVPNTTKTAPGMNPPHGEPGHRCDIAVGAPLNSKPATPANTPPALVTPAKTDSTKN